jgi:hypothetical protein
LIDCYGIFLFLLPTALLHGAYEVLISYRINDWAFLVVIASLLLFALAYILLAREMSLGDLVPRSWRRVRRPIPRRIQSEEIESAPTVSWRTPLIFSTHDDATSVGGEGRTQPPPLPIPEVPRPNGQAATHPEPATGLEKKRSR